MTLNPSTTRTRWERTANNHLVLLVFLKRDIADEKR
jgi:hypothetical protein